MTGDPATRDTRGAPAGTDPATRDISGAPAGARPRAGDFLTDLFRSPLDPGYAAAARRRAGRPAPTGVRHATAVGARAAALLGIGFVLAVAHQHVVAAQPQTTRARVGLAADVQARRAETDDLSRRADRLREQVAAERDAALSANGEGARLRDLEAGAGLAAVRGDGTVVRLADAAPPVDPVTGRPSTTNPGRVLDHDLQDVANELWRLGAEAIAINGERLTATTTIRAAGGAILVDFRPITAPYQVSAIGPHDVRSRFVASATAKRFRAYAATYRMQFSVRDRADLTLPAAGEPSLRYAHPIASPVPSASGGGR
ncbi:MAG: hypothetical protein QOI74_2522 [Micromonosporaceae bacterium]|nr:hypothetical protein [Micromonosporaceae bacterium]